MPVGYVVNQHKTLRALEKTCRQRVKPLLPRRVPDLMAPGQIDTMMAPANERDREGETDRRRARAERGRRESSTEKRGDIDERGDKQIKTRNKKK